MPRPFMGGPDEGRVASSDCPCKSEGGKQTHRSNSANGGAPFGWSSGPRFITLRWLAAKAPVKVMHNPTLGIRPYFLKAAINPENQMTSLPARRCGIA